MRVPFLLFFAAVPLAAQAPTIKNPRKECTALPAIDSTGLMTDVFKIADDSTKGRTIGSKENEKVRTFLARRFQDVGLRTIGDLWIHPVPSRNGVVAANVVGIVKGTKFPDEYIVVTGHYDHIGMAGQPGSRCRPIGADSICNGADDNASGTAALAILAKYFVAAKPAHSVVFAAVDGEEAGGMAGSNGFVNTPTVPLDNILLNVNLDMMSRNVNKELYAAGATKYPQLLPLLEEIEQCSPVNLKLGHDGSGNTRDDWTNQSDQGSFHKKGIPFVYFGVEDHPDYHKAGDSPDKIMPGFFVGAVQTAADFIQRFDKKPVARVKNQANQ